MSVDPQVALVACDSYEPSHVVDAVKRGISLLGGIDCFVRKNEKILLKLPGDVPFKSNCNLSTTHEKAPSATFSFKSFDCEN
jgi:hypothetical protein